MSIGERCIACGMPMEKAEDHAAGDPSRDYCVHCTRPDGTMQSYEEKLDSMTDFIVRAQGLSRETAKAKASELMADLPAWKGGAES